MASFYIDNITSTSVNITVSPDATNNYYRVYVRNTSGTVYYDEWKTYTGTVTHTITISGLDPDTGYVANVAYNTTQSASGSTWIGAQSFTTDEDSEGSGDLALLGVGFETDQISRIRLKYDNGSGSLVTSTFSGRGSVYAVLDTEIEVLSVTLAAGASYPVYCDTPSGDTKEILDASGDWLVDTLQFSEEGWYGFWTPSTDNCIQCYIDFDTNYITQIRIKHYADDNSQDTETTTLKSPGYITARIGTQMEIRRLDNDENYYPVYCVFPDGTYQEVVDETNDWGDQYLWVPSVGGTFLFTNDPEGGGGSGGGPGVTVELGQGINSVEVYYVSSETNGGNQDIITETTTFRVNTNYDMQIKSIRLRDNYKHPAYCVGDTTWQMTDEDGSFLDPYLQSLSDGKNFQLYATESTGEGGVYINGQYYEAYIYTNGTWLKHDCYICTNETNGTMEVTKRQ